MSPSTRPSAPTSALRSRVCLTRNSPAASTPKAIAAASTARPLASEPPNRRSTLPAANDRERLRSEEVDRAQAGQLEERFPRRSRRRYGFHRLAARRRLLEHGGLLAGHEAGVLSNRVAEPLHPLADAGRRHVLGALDDSTQLEQAVEIVGGERGPPLTLDLAHEAPEVALRDQVPRSTTSFGGRPVRQSSGRSPTAPAAPRARARAGAECARSRPAGARAGPSSQSLRANRDGGRRYAAHRERKQRSSPRCHGARSAAPERRRLRPGIG